MEVNTRYVVYKLNPIMGSEVHLSLEIVSFKGFQSNMFDTEQEAIDCLVKNGMTYRGYIIMKEVYITDY